MRCEQILAPTLLEYWAARRTLLGANVRWAGVRLARWKRARDGSSVVVCGLAGALAPGLHPGTVLVPESVGLPDGRTMRCDPELVQALVAAARTLGFEPDTGPLLTARSMVVGPARQEWTNRGFVAVDMETGLLAGRNLRMATIRVVLDSPNHGISRRWLKPAGALLRPRLWSELFWLWRVAPPYALRAATVLKVGLEL
jgi:Phosphorylase superfamily